ncbi:cell division protein ZapA [Variibacter gotjawalensis]|nr:cell division protein ZapA [Variibacter gotjawalensis]
MACEDGQEDHLRELAEQFDKRIEDLRGQLGEIGDSRLTVVAALMLSDELSEAQRRIAKLEQDHGERIIALHGEISEAREASAGASLRAQATNTAIIAALNSAAERVEKVTKSLNGTLTTSVPMG